MPTELAGVRALTWDIGGTVFDWHHSITREVERLAARRSASVDAAAFANQWRRGMFEELGRVRSGELPWMNADALHRRVLDEVAAAYPQLGLSAAELDHLNSVWHRLAAWPDVAGSIRRLRTRYTVVVLTVLSWSIAVDSSKRAGIQWDGVLSCEFLGHYKPDAEAYQAACRLLGTAPSETMMVAAHPWDLSSAAAAGLRTAYVPRRGEMGEPDERDLSPLAEFDVNAVDFPDLARQLVGRGVG